MDALLESFEYVSDISDKIDTLIEEAGTVSKKERHAKLKEAQTLADAYEKYVGRRLFVSIISWHYDKKTNRRTPAKDKVKKTSVSARHSPKSR